MKGFNLIFTQLMLWGFAFLGAYPTAYASPKIPQALLTNSLVYCTSASGFSFNPQKADVGSNMNIVTEQIYDKLIEFDPEQNQLKPALAERFEMSEDGLTITLYLRKKVSFHHTKWFTPTRYLTSEDVIFSLNRILGKVGELPELNREVQHQVRHRIADRTHFSYFESVDLANQIVEISAPSSHIVKIRLAQPDSSILAHLASQYAVILSKEYALQLNADDNLMQLDILPVGTGVYQLDNYVQNDFVRLQPNPRYWGKKANISNLVVDFSTSGTGRMAKFLNNECDISAFPEPSQLSILDKTQGYVIETAGANLAFLAFNFRQDKMKDPALRQKIATSIDRERLARILFYGVAEVPQNVLPKALYAQENPTSYPYYPPDTSKKMEETDRLTLWVIDEKRVYHLHPLKMAEYLRAELAKVGITLNVRQVSRAYLTQQLENHQADYDLILSGWLANNFDPDSFLSSILSCRLQDAVTNLSNWCSVEFDELLKLARTAEDPQSRMQYYQQLQTLLEERLPLLPLVNVKRLLVANNSVKNVKISAFGQVKLSDIKVK
ncbi:ABC transporter substrate-binding protein [Glaesserella parasuis]|uniref:ABC transporter substrate-binding protein n=1 Tax=Glaesserella parasuis TaxID=738 RepID=UPI003851D910